jgi:hypothetical protein
VNELKDLSQIPEPPKEPARALVDRRSRHHRYDQRQEKVVNGIVKWKPIDKVAARVVAPASWNCQPPQPEPKFMKQNTGGIRTERRLTEDGHVEEVLLRDDVERMAVAQREHQTENSLTNLATLEARARDIHGALDYLLSNMEEPFLKSSELIGKHLALLREKRYAIDTETRLMMNQLKEVRQFFLDEKHDREVDRLREFVDLCERLKALKDSGFLDTIADTILKL